MEKNNKTIKDINVGDTIHQTSVIDGHINEYRIVGIKKVKVTDYIDKYIISTISLNDNRKHRDFSVFGENTPLWFMN